MLSNLHPLFHRAVVEKPLAATVRVSDLQRAASAPESFWHFARTADGSIYAGLALELTGRPLLLVAQAWKLSTLEFITVANGRRMATKVDRSDLLGSQIPAPILEAEQVVREGFAVKKVQGLLMFYSAEMEFPILYEETTTSGNLFLWQTIRLDVGHPDLSPFAPTLE
jgi:hypothetical protein